MEKEKMKSKIISDLEFNKTPTYRSYGVEREFFISIVDELAKEEKVIYELIDLRLPNGDLHPHHGDIKYIRLIRA